MKRNYPYYVARIPWYAPCFTFLSRFTSGTATVAGVVAKCKRVSIVLLSANQTGVIMQRWVGRRTIVIYVGHGARSEMADASQR